jgi:hypothetical protein
MLKLSVFEAISPSGFQPRSSAVFSLLNTASIAAALHKLQQGATFMLCASIASPAFKFLLPSLS